MKTCVYNINSSEIGLRVDQFLTEKTGLTRSEVQKWIKEGLAHKDSKVLKANYRLEEQDVISFSWKTKEKIEIYPENIPLNILFEDQDILVINKKRGMVVHPAPGNGKGTLVNALLYHCGDGIKQVGSEGRPGIVHRLDKDTSGVMVVAKTSLAYNKLQKDIATHTVQRKYVALVHGQMAGDHGEIRLPLGRSNKDRMKWDVQPETGKTAITHFRVLEYLNHYSWGECRLETGRTHQIRVHMAHIRHPVVNDPLYGWKKDDFPISGQALHSCFLAFIHPVTEEHMCFNAPIPNDLQQCLERARKE